MGKELVCGECVMSTAIDYDVTINEIDIKDITLFIKA